ncbi:galactokinase [Roseibacillus ishigakijimensis]|uniref:Galactokinase n=1 Tax=Roseibacillus ishigakijimensis TaxID=454146 RepID=A0A934RP20_9BACT|nr:galactokinase [Roseibacillus ishigakijimensis]MBK1832509.1 galactokinase [Roseibacillus ishigakijimensis]
MTLQPNDNLADLASDAKSQLKYFFDSDATFVAAAPGRVNLIGEHIDYCDGFVLPLAIERYIVIAAAPNGKNEIHLRSVGQPEAVIPLDGEITLGEPKWSNYVRGVVAGFRARGHEIPGFDACFVSSVPTGGGLSSSAALECAVATLLEGFLDTTLDTKEKALLAQKAEHEFAGVPCGIMDQFASAFGQKDQLVLIDCQSEEPELVPFTNAELEILVANTKVSHDLSDGGYAARRKDTEDGLAAVGKSSWRDVTRDEVEAAKDAMGDRVFRRSRHVVSEIERTIQAAQCFKSNDYGDIGRLMKASHESLRDDFEVSCRELDLMVEIAESIGQGGGVLGCRMTGGGFGGSTVTLCHREQAREIATAMHEHYLAETKIAPEIFATRPAQGAHLL